MSTPVEIALLVGSPVEPQHLIRTALGDVRPRQALGLALDAEVRVSVISWAPSAAPFGTDTTVALQGQAPGATDRVLRRLGLPAASRWLARYPIGRLINSLSPGDQSRVFARAVRRSPEALRVLDGCSIVIAADPPAVRTAWKLLHGGRVERAFLGLPAAVKELSRH